VFAIGERLTPARDHSVDAMPEWIARRPCPYLAQPSGRQRTGRRDLFGPSSASRAHLVFDGWKYPARGDVVLQRADKSLRKQTWLDH
jgi:hypothetical protein